MPSSSRVFASLQQAETSALAHDELENRPGIVVGHRGGRQVEVTGTLEISAAPDRARVCMRVTSSKGVASEAKSSVQRRLEYIDQSLRQTGISEENITISKEFHRTLNTYQMEAEERSKVASCWSLVRSHKEMAAHMKDTIIQHVAFHHRRQIQCIIKVLILQVCVIFSDFEKLQSICNLLVEKLDRSITICSPHFYHSPERMEKLRREVCLGAVSNAKRKAQEVCHLVGQSLGKALIIKEEEMREWQDQSDTCSSTTSIQQKIKSATISAASKVYATFEIKGKEGNKKNC